MPIHKKGLIVLLVVFLVVSYFLGYTPVLLSVVILFSSLLAYIAYAKDKTAAINNGWRVPEKTLHLSSLFFGWPGAMIAQERLRHKTKKLSFRLVFWLTVFVNFSVMAMLHTPEGEKALKKAAMSIEQVLLNEIAPDDVSDIVLTLIKLRSS